MTDDDFRDILAAARDGEPGGPFWLTQLSRDDDQRAALEALTACTFALAASLGLHPQQAEAMVWRAFEEVRDAADQMRPMGDRLDGALTVAEDVIAGYER